MIVTVTLNPAWDITHTVRLLEPGSTHRAEAVHERPGGKGVNVSRVLHSLGHPTLATGYAPGPTGDRLRAALAHAGVPEDFATYAGGTRGAATGRDGATAGHGSTGRNGAAERGGTERGGATAGHGGTGRDAAPEQDDTERGGAPDTRRTVTTVESGTGRATVVTEPGPAVADWPALLDHLDAALAGAGLVVLTGSLPPAVPPDAYRILVERAHRHGVPAVVDADGAALTHALAAGPDLVKPNTAELRAATGLADPVAGGRWLLAAGARRVVVSDGPAGLTGLDEHGGVVRAVPAPLTAVNPTGAGDAAVAALAAGLLAGRDWPDLLRTAAAWSAAAVLEPYAGSVAADRIPRLARSTTVTGRPDPYTRRSAPC